MTGQPTKREALPWFAFNVAEYLKDTMRLVTESHGAYLLLMLDYYSTGEPCPDDDFVLAAVAKLPQEAWLRHRKVLASYFDLRDGKWFHSRIEREMLEAERKHSLSIARATAGGHARWAREPAKLPNPAKKRRNPPGKSLNDASSMPQAVPAAMPEQCLDDAHLTLTNNSLSVDVLTVKKDNSGDNSKVEQIEEEATIGAPIDQAFQPNAAIKASCLAEFDASTVELEIQKFIYHHLEKATWSHDWQASFQKWWARFKEHHTKTTKPKAPPRIEVNTKSPDESVGRMLDMFVRGARWSHQFGPEPGQLGCTISPDLLRKHGIDPATGMKLKEPAGS